MGDDGQQSSKLAIDLLTFPVSQIWVNIIMTRRTENMESGTLHQTRGRTLPYPTLRVSSPCIHTT